MMEFVRLLFISLLVQMEYLQHKPQVYHVNSIFTAIFLKSRNFTCDNGLVVNSASAIRFYTNIDSLSQREMFFKPGYSKQYDTLQEFGNLTHEIQLFHLESPCRYIPLITLADCFPNITQSDFSKLDRRHGIMESLGDDMAIMDVPMCLPNDIAMKVFVDSFQ